MRTLSLAAGALLLVGCATTEPYPVLQSDEPALETGSLAFTGIDGNLYVAAPDADEIIQMTRDASPDAPARRYSGYSWAGGELVYVTQDGTDAGEISTTLYAAEPGRARRVLYRKDGLAPFFLNPAPDGTRVGYLGNEAESGTYVMGSVDLESGEHMLYGRGQPFYAAWSPDGAALITHVGLPGGRTASLLSIAGVNGGRTGEGAQPLELSPGPFQTPDYAPDGSSIAVVLRREGSSGIHILSESGSDQGRLVTLQGSAGSVAWSPDGSRLAYIDGLYTRIGALVGRLFIARFGSQRPQLISEAAIAHFWSPDSTKLLYFEPVVLRGGGDERLGYKVGMHSLLSGSSETIATMVPAPTFAQQIIPFVDQYERGYTIWSPDSRLVALNAQAVTGEPVIHLVDTETVVSGDAFRVSYSPVQAEESGELGLLPAEGVQSRAFVVGTVPFFSKVE